MSIAARSVTVDEYEAFIALPANEDRTFELIDGGIVEKMPRERHGFIIRMLKFSISTIRSKAATCCPASASLSTRFLRTNS